MNLRKMNHQKKVEQWMNVKIRTTNENHYVVGGLPTIWWSLNSNLDEVQALNNMINYKHTHDAMLSTKANKEIWLTLIGPYANIWLILIWHCPRSCVHGYE